MENPFIVEKVKCCVCAGTGKVKRFKLFSKACSVCHGEGERRILNLRHAAPIVQDDIRLQAMSVPTGFLGMANSLANRIL